LIVVLMVLLSSCSWASGSTDQKALEAGEGRPLQPVPSVRPAGFAAPPAGAGLSRYEQQPLRWKACQGGLQCATVLVPLDYNRPDDTAITLALAKKVATSRDRLGTLFINPGGPGGSGVNYTRTFRTTGLEGYDIVGWDPRGVGRSTPVSCAGVDLDRYLSMDISPDDAAEEDALLEADRQLGQKCLERSGPLLQHISTDAVARDLHLLRQLVGEDTVNFFGASYGTQIGATYAELFPRQVGRMVLDGAVNITEDTSVTQAVGFERALEGFADWCAGRDCALGSTRAAVLDSIRSLLTRLDASPVAVGDRQLTQQLAVTGVVAILYANQDYYRYLLQALSAAVGANEGVLLLELADSLNQRTTGGGYGQINYAFPAVRCLDDHDQGVQGEQEIAKAASEKASTVGPFFGADLVCSMWPVAPVPKLHLVGAGAAPIVVVGTTGDPATPYEYAVSMAEQLQSGVLVTFKGRGHTAYGQSACVQQRVVSYLVNGVVPADGTVC
jgi:pimeloyl-ACP methyl ester carboxylesterase